MYDYNPEDDIRDHYRAQLRRIDNELACVGKRDPRKYQLLAERKLVRSYLDNLPALHTHPTGALAEYGTW